MSDADKTDVRPGRTGAAGSRDSLISQLVVVAFSRFPEALDDAASLLQSRYGPIGSVSPDFDFAHTRYYQASMGVGLKKRFLVFEPLVPPDCLPEVKNHTIRIEQDFAASGRFSAPRPINLDPGLLQLGKFLLATTKDQGHRIYLRDGIFAEVTLRFQAGGFEIWPWTYRDYQEPAWREFLNHVRAKLYERILKLRDVESENAAGD